MIKPKLALIPSGYKGGSGEGTVYSILPNDATGDFDYERNGYATRVRKDGLIEELTVDDTPRLDWHNSNCPSLLLEPQRSNIQTYSESSTGKTTQNVTLTDNSTISPNGELTAIKVTDDSVNFRHRFWANNVSVTSGTEYTISFYVKKDSPNRYIYINAGILGTNGSFSLDDQSTTGSVEVFETLNNDWYRIGLTGTAPTTTTSIWFLQMQLGTTDANYIGDGSSFFVWGLQFEQGSYPTSYIKTEVTPLSRLKDDCHLLNQTLFTDYPFTVYAKAKVDNFSNVAFSLIDSLASNKYLSIQFTSSSQIGVLRRDASNNDSDYYTFSYSIGDTLKIAISYVNDTAYKLYVNGTELADITSGSSIPFDHNDIILGQFRIASDTGTRNSIDDFRVYDYTLTNTELTELTTL